MLQLTRRRVAALAVLSVAGPVLSACGGGAAKVSDVSTTSAPAMETTVEAAEEVATTEAPSENPKFGQKATWSDGVSVTVSEPSDFTPSEYAAGVTGGTPKLFEVTIENGSQKNVDPQMFFFSAQSGSQEASEIYDTEQGLDMTPTTTLLPGKSVNFKIAFDLADPSDITMEVGVLDFEKDSIYFTN